MAFEKDPSELGCLWNKSGPKGPYMTGEISGVQVVAFPVKSTNPKAPAWRILKSQPRDGQSNSTRQPDTPETDHRVESPDADDIAF